MTAPRRRLRVGLTVGARLERARPYVHALELAGLEVRVLGSEGWEGLPPDPQSAAQALLADLDGLVLAGGGDIDPVLQGLSEAHPTVAYVERARDLMERATFECAWAQDMPTLGICRGMQVMNWVLGGTLTADIDTLLEPCGLPKGHRQTDHGIARHALTHAIRVDGASRLARALGCDRVLVNSIHHQALDTLAPSLRPTAWAPDGIVEAVEAPDRAYILGVQFHPEELVDEAPLFRGIFEDFATSLQLRA